MTTLTTTALAELADEYWQAFLEFSPIAATSIGVRHFDDRLDDPSPEASGDQRRRLAAFGERAKAIDPGALEGADAVTRSALIDQITSDVAALETGLEEWAVDPIEGPQVEALDLEAIQSVSTPNDARAMVSRWRALGPWFDQHAANLRRGLAAGRVAVRTPVERAVEQIDGILARPDAELPLLNPLEAEHPDWSDADRDAFEEGLRSAVRDIVRPALARYGAVISEEILPAARPDDRPGILHVDGGREAYPRLIRLHTSLDLSPDDIHRIGLDEVARIDRELAALGGRVFGTTDTDAIRSRLRSDAALHFTTRDEVFTTAEQALARARTAIPDWFGLLPQADCDVVRMGEHEEKHSTLAYYRQPAVDGSRPGQYYINTHAPETRPRYEAEALAYHESIPGHHLQIAIGQELTDLPEFRKHLGPTAFFEGWGLYTERLSDEMGLYSGDLDRFGILSFDGWRACRLVLDTGIHALGWTRQQAIDYMTAHTALEPNNIANEVDRYMVWPGQALAYKIGQLEILRLRAEARAAAGSRFDIRAFHDAVLGQGAVGLETLRDIVRSRFAKVGGND
ncbi:MAG: DUF885 domain-containing protein [Chloroflexota bacterium]|nr:DUF885 domain-containing protein [Chloroflexota bacterium]